MTFWLRLHTIGWPIWAPVTLAFIAVLIWARPNEKARAAVPWVLLAAFLTMVAGDYARSDWHHVFYTARRLWLGGVLAMMAHAAIPLTVGLATEWALSSRPLPAWKKFALAGCASIAATILFGYAISHGIQVLIRGG